MLNIKIAQKKFFFKFQLNYLKKKNDKTFHYDSFQCVWYIHKWILEKYKILMSKFKK